MFGSGVPPPVDVPGTAGGTLNVTFVLVSSIVNCFVNGLPAASQSHTDGCFRMEESAPEKRRTYPFRFIHKWRLTIMILYLSYYFSDISVSHNLQTYTEKPSPKNISGNSELDVRNIDLPKAVRRKPKRRGRHLASLRQFPDCYIFRQMAYPLPPRI